MEQQPNFKVGDTVRFVAHRFNEHGALTDRVMKVTGKLVEIESHCEETDYPKYHVKRNGKIHWYSGSLDNIHLIKSNQNAGRTTKTNTA